MLNQPMSPAQAYARLCERARRDEGFRQLLKSDPRAAIREELGVTPPATLTIHVHENTPDTVHLVLPAPEHGRELSSKELASVVGAGSHLWWPYVP